MAVDLEIGAGVTLLLEARLEKYGAGADIVRNARGFQAVEPQTVEGEIDQGADSPDRIAPSDVRLADPVADGAHLGDAPADVPKGDAANERASLLFEDEEGIGLPPLLILRVGGEAAAKRRPCEVVRRPSRLPGLQEAA